MQSKKINVFHTGHISIGGQEGEIEGNIRGISGQNRGQIGGKKGAKRGNFQTKQRAKSTKIRERFFSTSKMCGGFYGWLCHITDSHNYRKYNNKLKKGEFFKIIFLQLNLYLPLKKRTFYCTIYLFSEKQFLFFVFMGPLGGIFRHFYQKKP